MRKARALVVLLGIALVAGGCPGSVQFPKPPAGTPTYAERGEMTPGRIVDLDARRAFMVVEFPWGKTILSVDRRELQHFRPNDEILFDQNLRPVWSEDGYTLLRPSTG